MFIYMHKPAFAAFSGFLSTREIPHQAFRREYHISGQRNTGHDPTIPIYIPFRELHCSLFSTSLTTLNCCCHHDPARETCQAPNNRLQPYSQELTHFASSPGEKKRRELQLSVHFLPSVRKPDRSNRSTPTSLPPVPRYSAFRQEDHNALHFFTEKLLYDGNTLQSADKPALMLQDTTQHVRLTDLDPPESPSLLSLT